MKDRELLELAAKAAGYEIESSPAWGGGIAYRANGYYWNPLSNDADALRLAAALRLHINFLKGFEEVRVEGETLACSPSVVGTWLDANEPFGSDIYAATRRAITRAAAEIGRSMP